MCVSLSNISEKGSVYQLTEGDRSGATTPCKPKNLYQCPPRLCYIDLCLVVREVELYSNLPNDFCIMFEVCIAIHECVGNLLLRQT
jgi:hypothetical protein